MIEKQFPQLASELVKNTIFSIIVFDRILNTDGEMVDFADEEELYFLLGTDCFVLITEPCIDCHYSELTDRNQ